MTGAELVVHHMQKKQEETLRRLDNDANNMAQELRQWLSERGYVDDGGYVLAAQEVQLLNEAFPELNLPACTIQLILEAEA